MFPKISITDTNHASIKLQGPAISLLRVKKDLKNEHLETGSDQQRKAQESNELQYTEYRREPRTNPDEILQYTEKQKKHNDILNYDPPRSAILEESFDLVTQHGLESALVDSAPDVARLCVKGGTEHRNKRPDSSFSGSIGRASAALTNQTKRTNKRVTFYEDASPRSQANYDR